MKAGRSIRNTRRDFLQAAAATLVMGSLPFTARAADKLKIGIVGSGRVGSALGTVWANAGHTVMFSSLDLEKDKALAASVGHGARAGSSREAAAFGDVVMISVPYSAYPHVAKDIGGLLKGKVVIDTSNPIPTRDGEVAEKAKEKGAGIAAMEYLPGARIVRAFNAIGAARMGEAHKTPGKIGMPVAGDDKKAIEIASGLIREIGYEPVLIGGAVMGRHLVPREPLGGEHTPDELRRIAATLK